LALTFTEKAAAEMAQRLRQAMGDGLSSLPLVATFHGFCHQLVQEFSDDLGFRAPPRLLTGPLYIRFLLDVLDDVLVSEHIDLVQRQVDVVQTLAEFLSRCHDEDLIGKDLVAEADSWLAAIPAAQRRKAAEVRDLAACLPRLLERQYAENIVSFGDLLTLAVRLCREHTDVCAKLQRRFDYILVDELQDNNLAQFQVVNALADSHRHIFAVGDEDQCIYRFRGAGWNLLDQFRRHWRNRAGPWHAEKNRAGFREISLTDNYRSSAQIVALCQALIRHNRVASVSDQAGPPEASQQRGEPAGRASGRRSQTDGVPPSLFRLESEEQERAFVCSDIVRRLRSGTRPGDLAILCRSLGHIAALAADLRRAGVSLEVVGEAGILSDSVVRELLAWLRALHDPEHEEIALYRLLLGLGLSPTDQRALAEIRKTVDLPLMALFDEDRLLAVSPARISDAGIQLLRAFHSAFLRMARESNAANRPDVAGLLSEILEITGLQHRLAPPTIAGQQHRAAVQGLLALAEQYQTNYPRPSLSGFLEFADLLEEFGRDDVTAEPSNSADTVKVMTVHKSKGCEFPVVYVTGLLDHFPIANRRESYRKLLDHILLPDSDIDQLHLEEERRVLYVALSRAQRELVLTLYESKNGKGVPHPSPFVEEIESAGVVEVQKPAVGAETVAATGAVLSGSPLASTSRAAAEARLFQLVSRLGAQVHSGAGLRRALGEAIRLCVGLLAEGARGGHDSVREALLELGVPRSALDPLLPQTSDFPGLTGPIRLSTSGVETFEECPRRYYYRYVAGIPDPLQSDASFGAGLRRVVKRWHQGQVAGQNIGLQELLTQWESELAQVSFLGRQEREQAVLRGREILSQYFREEAARSTGVASTAIDKPFDIYLGDDITLHGRWDRVDALEDDRIRVVTYRSGRLQSRPEYLRGRLVPAQALAVQEDLHRPLAAVEVVSLRELKSLASGSQIARWQFPWEDGSDQALTEERLDELRGEIRTTAAQIRAGAFAARPEKDRCAGCSFRQLCDQAWGSNDAG
jgi:DNA helicase-2/ATP-dependent DNA helicase PcrA